MRIMVDFYDENLLRELRTPNQSTIYAIKNGWIKSGDKILDVGCGIGGDVNYLINDRYEAIGIDNNWPKKRRNVDMIARGKKMFGNIPIIEGDMRAIGFRSKMFDVFLFNSSLNYLCSQGDLRVVFDEVERLAKPKARIIGDEFSNKSTDPDIRQHIDVHGALSVEVIIEELDRRGYNMLRNPKKKNVGKGKIYYMFAYMI